MNRPSKPRLSAPLRHLIAFAAVLFGGWLGFVSGRQLVYAIAALTDRDIAALKDMVIYGSVAGSTVGAIGCVWLAVTFTRGSAEARRIAQAAFGMAVLVDASLMLVSFEWPKSSGRPVVQYELRLPAGLSQPQPQSVTVTLWRNTMGQGSTIAALRRAGDRPEIAGSFVIASGDPEQMLSLQLDRSREGYWRMPIRPDAPLDQDFGPWQRIDFVPTPRADVPPLPPGHYDVRYRVRRYI